MCSEMCIRDSSYTCQLSTEMLPVFKTMRSFHRFVATFKVFIAPPVTGLVDVVEFTRNSGVFKGFLKAGDLVALFKFRITTLAVLAIATVYGLRNCGYRQNG